jgi:hypothetical protein
MTKDYSHIAAIDGKPVVAMFASLALPRRFGENSGKPSGDPKFQIDLIIPKDHPKLKVAQQVEATQAAAKGLRTGYSSRFEDGNARWARLGDKASYARDSMILHATSLQANPPRLSVRLDGKTIDFDRDSMSAAELKREEGRYFFWGALVLAQVSFRAYDPTPMAPFGAVACYINHVVSTARGTRIGGGDTDSRFSYDYEGEVSDFDPFAVPKPNLNLLDAGPF